MNKNMVSRNIFCLFLFLGFFCVGCDDEGDCNQKIELSFECSDIRETFFDPSDELQPPSSIVGARPAGLWWLQGMPGIRPAGADADLLLDILDKSDPPTVKLNGLEVDAIWRTEVAGGHWFSVPVPPEASAGDEFTLRWEGLCGSEQCTATTTLSVVEKEPLVVVQATGEGRLARCSISCFAAGELDRIVHAVRVTATGGPTLRENEDGTLSFVLFGGEQYLDVASQASPALQEGSATLRFFSVDTLQLEEELVVPLPEVSAPALTRERAADRVCGEPIFCSE